MKTRHGLEIRAATAGDAQGLSELLKAAGNEIPPRVMAERLDAPRREPGAILIAASLGPPAGVVSLHWYHAIHTDQPTARITLLLVDPNERRKGIGRLLIKTAAHAARTAGCAMLEVYADRDTQGLREFCRATGFNELGDRFVRPLRKTGRGSVETSEMGLG